MSRIYEALQRAEAERETGTESIAVRGGYRPAAVVTLDHDMDTETPFVPAEVPQIQRPALRLQEAPPASIQQHPWKLSTDRLPSLGKRGPAVEQFRSLRSRVQEFRASNKLKSLLVSSGLPQEGKSFVAANLAMSLALHKNSRVLLIDGDMRRPTLHTYFGTHAQPGLSDYLASRASIADVMQAPDPSSSPEADAARILNNLVLIPSGEGGDKAADLAGNKKFDELIATLEPQFDWIVVDSSPVLPVSDAVSLARACDAVLLVARSATTTFPVAQRAQNELKASRIIGFVLNGVKQAPALGNYYGYDGTGE